MPEKLAKYRLYAAECTELAQQVTDPKRRLVLVEMAHAWWVLAELAEKRVAQQQKQALQGESLIDVPRTW
jgi:hypothetical protein